MLFVRSFTVFALLTLGIHALGRAEDRLKFRSLQIPPSAELGSVVNIHTTVVDERGVKSLEVVLDDKVISVELDRPSSMGVFSGNWRPRNAGLNKVVLTPISTDGERGDPKVKWVAVPDYPRIADPDWTPEDFLRFSARWREAGLKPTEMYPRPKELYKNLYPLVIDYDTDWWTDRVEGGTQPFDWEYNCGADEVTPYGEVLRCWLKLYGLVGWIMEWAEVNPVTGAVTRKSYQDWSDTQKVQLDVAFYHAYHWLKNGLGPFNGNQLVDPPQNQLKANGEKRGASTVLKKNDAWQLYVETMGHCLALEIGGFVPWSVTTYLFDHMKTIFNSESMFNVTLSNTYLANPNNPGVVHFGYSCKGVSHAPPQLVFQYLVDYKIIKWSHYYSISSMLKWTRENVYHYGGGGDADNMYNHWQYIGAPPVSRILEGTERSDPPSKKTSWIEGCGGVAQFYASVFRALNVPVVYLYGIGGSGHSTPVFSSIGRTLSHGDDAHAVDNYNLPTLDPDYLPPDRVMISFDKFNSWFFPHGPNAEGNVAKRPMEISLEILPNKILDRYCDDLRSGVPQSAGSVFKVFMDYYTYNELLALKLWERLEAKRTKLNYCDL